MEFAIKQPCQWVLVISLQLQACSTGSTTAMAAEHSRDPSRHDHVHLHLPFVKVETVRELDVAPGLSDCVCGTGQNPRLIDTRLVEHPVPSAIYEVGLGVLM